MEFLLKKTGYFLFNEKGSGEEIQFVIFNFIDNEISVIKNKINRRLE